ncbi:uncharacterized protein LY89DRAFT_678087 [Mollisia scopiformis]|uniref:2EXR domain-containing protein n=1 Tax=Mollisia scopiformis TaxID=149040 RepID=A0A132B554_MOLSC|nr:uncharacterized protein LY89DRAFT_678087 [Mollisia scopiformis]KUJ07119.1 hypothetical protein LY89DRAFT_678087 [Mollisia scopiformis]
MTPNTFHKFPKLSLELRWMVWGFALPEAQVVEIEWSSRTQSWFCPTESAHKPNSFLETCKESREYYLRDWIPLATDFGSDSPHHSLMRSHLAANIKFPVVYFNPSIDTIYAHSNSGRLPDAAVEAFPLIFGLRHLAIVRLMALRITMDIHRGWRQIGRSALDNLTKMTRELKDLDTVTIVDNNGPVRYKSWKRHCRGAIELRERSTFSRTYIPSRASSGLEAALSKSHIKVVEAGIWRGGKHMGEWARFFDEQGQSGDIIQPEISGGVLRS